MVSFKGKNLIGLLIIALLVLGIFSVIGAASADDFSSIDEDSMMIGSNDLSDSISSNANDDSLSLDAPDSDSGDSLLSSSTYEKGNALKDSSSQTFYVSKDGNDSNSGLSEDDSFATISKAMYGASDVETPSVIYIGEGEFSEETTIFCMGNFTFIGQGINKTILNGQNSHRIFDVYEGSVTFINLTFINGFETNYGGAIRISQGNISLMNCSFSDNMAQMSGGAIYNEFGNLSIVNCSFSNNKAIGGANCFGGAISNLATLDVSDSIFENNSCGGIYNFPTGGAIYNGKAYGGAIYNEGKLSISKSNFTNNSLDSYRNPSMTHTVSSDDAVQKGGAVFSLNNSISIIGSVFDGNNLKRFGVDPFLNISGLPDEYYQSVDSLGFFCYSEGGAIYLEGKNYSFINCSFINNTADNGGAVFFKANYTSFDSCSFKNNSAYMGAALMVIDYNQNDRLYNLHDLNQNELKNLTIINSLFDNNFIINSSLEKIGFRIGYGGGAGYLKIDNILVSDSNFTNNGLLEDYTSYYYESGSATYRYCHSGALFLDGQNSIVDSCNFIKNKGEVGGAIHNYGFDTKIINSNFTQNIACLLDGGAIFHSIGDLVVDNCSFDSNIAINNGGAIQSTYDYTTNHLFQQNSVYNNSRFINNSAAYGGGIFDSGDLVNYENLEFINNSAFYGGAIYSQGFSNNYINSTFTNNTAFSKDYSNGGAIYNYGSNAHIESCNFTNNSADLEGGAIFNFGESAQVLNNFFYLNSAFKGGAVYLSGNGGRFEENKISSSSATYGGGLYNALNNLICLNNSFSDCEANVSGGAIYNLQSTLQLYDNLMSDCKANLSGLGSGDYVFTCGNISYLVVSFLNTESIDMVDNQPVLIFANVTDNMGNPISGGSVNFILSNQSSSSEESNVIGTSNLIEGLAFLRFDLPLELGSNYTISGIYSLAAEPVFTQIGNLHSVLSTELFLSSDIEDKVILGDDFTYELILLDVLGNYIPNAEILVYLDGVYLKSIFTDDVGHFNETVSDIAIIGTHYYNFIYEGDVYHNRVNANLSFDVFYNNTYYFDDIVITFSDLIYSIIETVPGSEIPYQFFIAHESGEGLENLSTSRYLLVYENNELLPFVEYSDYLGQGQGQRLLFNLISDIHGNMVEYYSTMSGGVFSMPISRHEPGLYEYTISFIGGLAKQYDPEMHNNVNEEDNYYNPTNISFILIIADVNANIYTQISYEGADNIYEVDYPSYKFNLTARNGDILADKEIRVYDNGSYLGSAFTDDEGLAEFTFPNLLDLGNHLINFVFIGDSQYSSTYSSLSLDVLENPAKEDVIFVNDSSLNITGPDNNYTLQIMDNEHNSLSNFTIDIEVLRNDFNGKSLSKNYTIVSDENGSFSIPIELGAGNYKINCSYGGSKWYKEYNKTFNLFINEVPTLLFGQSSMEVLKNDSYLTVILTTDDFKVLPNQKIIYYVLPDDFNTIDDAKAVFYAFTNESSISRLKINLPVGKYMLYTVFEGDKWYDNCSLLTNLSIYGDSSKLEANNDIIIKESGYYSVRLLDSNYNPIVGETINITVNGISYSRITDNDGEARLEINLAYGNYTIVSNYKGSINYTSSSVSSNLYVVDKNYKYPSLIKLNSSEIYRGTGYYEIILTGLNNERLVHRNVIVPTWIMILPSVHIS